MALRGTTTRSRVHQTLERSRETMRPRSSVSEVASVPIVSVATSSETLGSPGSPVSIDGPVADDGSLDVHRNPAKTLSTPSPLLGPVAELYVSYSSSLIFTLTVIGPICGSSPRLPLVVRWQITSTHLRTNRSAGTCLSLILRPHHPSLAQLENSGLYPFQWTVPMTSSRLSILRKAYRRTQPLLSARSMLDLRDYQDAEPLRQYNRAFYR